MIILVLAIIAGLITLGALVYGLVFDDPYMDFLMAAMGIILSFMAGAAVFEAVWLSGTGIASIWIGSHAKALPLEKLQQLGAGSQTNGSFFLGSGYIDQQAVFYYYAKDGNRFHLESANAAAAQVIEDASPQNAYVQCYEWVPNHKEWKLFNFNTYAHSCQFHVPPGSVMQNFNMSLPH